MRRACVLAMGLVGTLSLLVGHGSLCPMWAQQPTVKEGEGAPAQPGEAGPGVMEPNRLEDPGFFLHLSDPKC